MRLFLISLLIFTVSCSTAPVPKSKGKDGYRFEVKDTEMLTPNIEFIIIKNRKEYNDIRKKFFGHHWDTVQAFTRWRPESKTCIIYIKDPMWMYQPEYIGHEVAHCIWGNWHKMEIEPVNNYQDRLETD
jgi:hypothetical protein